jgi:hypothetical protein
MATKPKVKKSNLMPLSAQGLVIEVAPGTVMFVSFLSGYPYTEVDKIDRDAEKFVKKGVKAGWLPAGAVLTGVVPLTRFAATYGICLEEAFDFVRSHALGSDNARGIYKGQYLVYNLSVAQILAKIQTLVELKYMHQSSPKIILTGTPSKPAYVSEFI